MKLKKIIIGTTLLGCILVLPDAGRYCKKLALKFHRVPEVYRTCNTLDGLKDEDYDVLEIRAQYIEPILRLNDSVLLIAGSKHKEYDGGMMIKDFWYKLGPNGHIIDSLAYVYNNATMHTYKTLDRYIIDTGNDTYSNWISDGDTIRYPIKNLDQGRMFSKKEIEKILLKKEYAAKATQPFPADPNKTIDKLFLYDHGQWSYVLTDNYDDPKPSGSRLEITYSGSLTDENEGADPILREYIHKDKWIQYSFWDISRYLRWGTGNQSPINHWEGTSYFKIRMPQKTLYFKQANKIYEPSEIRESNHYKVFRPNDKKYLLLRGIEQEVCYIVRPRK